MTEWLKGYTAIEKIGFVLLVAVAAHLLVRLIRFGSVRLMSAGSPRSLRQTRTVASLATNAAVFTLYLAVLGYALFRFNVPRTGYVAGVSVLSVAVAFGLQELLAAFKEIDPAYADWMVAVNFEVEREAVAKRK